MVEFVHQGQQLPKTPRRKTCAGKPIEIVPRQVGNQAPFVLAKGHLDLNKTLQIVRKHEMKTGPQPRPVYLADKAIMRSLIRLTKPAGSSS